MLHKVDGGVDFGKWPNRTARIMYQDVMPFFLSGIDTTGSIADYGGANGLMKEWIPHAVTVDNDASKYPDVEDNILTHVGDYDLITMRYVMHYLSDAEVMNLFEHLRVSHAGKILLIQFVNEDLEIKNANSTNEQKWFRSEKHLKTLVSITHNLIERRAVDYRVDAEFYKWRLGLDNAIPHDETIVSYLLEA